MTTPAQEKAMTGEHTPGPFRVELFDGNHYRINAGTEAHPLYVLRTHGNSYGDKQDAEWFVGVANAHPTLAAEIEQQRAEIEQLRAALDEAKNEGLRIAHSLEPEKSETHLDQAAGYTFGWSQAVQAYRAAIRVALANGRPR